MPQKKKHLIRFFRLFFIFFCLTFAVEALGLPYGRMLAFVLISLSPLFLTSLYFIKKRLVFIPKLSPLFFLLFFLMLVISALTGADLKQGFRGVVLYLGLFTAFTIAVKSNHLLDRLFVKTLFILAIILPAYAIITRNFIYPYFPYLMPDSGYQLVFAKFGLHNHMGDFLAVMLPVFTFYYLSTNQKKYLLLELLLIPFILYSYSRSAYLTFVLLTLIVLMLKMKKPKLLSVSFISFFIIITLLFSLFTIKENNFPEVPQPLQPVKETFLIRDKQLWTPRSEYFSEALLTIKENPLFGVGFNNFIKASRKYGGPNNNSTDSSHNIFLDIAAENGIAAVLVFISFLVIVFKKSDKNIFFIISLGLLINFQTDYTHRIYGMLFLFFITSGLSCQKSSR